MDEAIITEYINVSNDIFEDINNTMILIAIMMKNN